jgi:ATP/ADP translocase/HEAT repeat protein
MGRTRDVDRWLEAAFRLHPGELRSTLLMFLQCHALVGAFVVGRSVRDTLFLARVSPQALPWVYVLGSLAVAGAGLAYARLLAHRRLDRLMPGTALAFAASLVAARLGLGATGRWLEVALYPWIEVMGAITVLQFWSFANEAHDSREAKRLFGLIAAGGTLAGVVSGFAVGGLARQVGAENLLWLAAGFLLAAALLARAVVRAVGPRRWTARPPAHAVDGPAIRDPLVRAMALVAVLTFLATTLVDYQFKSAAAAHFAGHRDELARFFGLLAGVTGLAALALQLAVTPRLLDRLGVAGALAVLPAALALGSAGILVAGGLVAVSLTRAAEQGLRYTVTDGATQLLYVPLPTPRRARAKAFVDGVVRPATIAATGLLLAAWPGGRPGAAALAALVLLLSLAWLASLAGVHRRYVGLLRDTLRRRRLDLAGVPRFGDEAARALRRALASPDPADVESALALAPEVESDLSAEVAPLLAHASPRIRQRACEVLARSGAVPLAGQVARLFDDPDPAVRAAAISAFCAMAGDKAVRAVRPHLAAPEPELRAAAVAGLIRHAGLDGILLAGEALKALLGSPVAAERVLAARVLGAIGVRSFYQPLLELLGDVDPAVRRAAIGAAGQLGSPELLPALVYRLARRDTARDAAAALAAFGPGVEPTLGRVLGNPLEEPAIRRAVPAVLARLATPEAAAILVRHVDAEDEALRHAVDHALVRIARQRPGVAVDAGRVTQALRAEVALAYRALAAAEALGLDDGAGRPPTDGAGGARHLLAVALREQLGRAVDRSLLLARVLHPAAGLELASAALGDPLRRAAAVEMIDAVLPKALKRRLVPLLDDRPRAARLREAEGLYELPRLGPDAWLGELLRDESPWLAAAAAHAAGALGVGAVAGRVRELLSHPVPWVREAALEALERLLPEAELAAAARELTADPFEPARARAARLARPPGPRQEARA